MLYGHIPLDYVNKFCRDTMRPQYAPYVDSALFVLLFYGILNI